MSTTHIKFIRQSLNITFEELAEKIGLAEEDGGEYLQAVENGKKKASNLLIRCLELYYNNIKQQNYIDHLNNKLNFNNFNNYDYIEQTEDYLDYRINKKNIKKVIDL